MTSVTITINEATVTGVHEFTSIKGYGVDYFITAQSVECTLYLQVVLYDGEARRIRDCIHEGDLVNVTGTLKDKPYTKKDGTAGHALLVERPSTFAKTAGRNSEQKAQKLYRNTSSKENGVNQAINVVSASASAATTEDSKDEAFCMPAEMTKSVELDSSVGLPTLKSFTDGSGNTYEYYYTPDDDVDYDVPF